MEQIFTAESKSQLAKLLAQENIFVQHQKMQTAMFDTKNRVLYLPIWQDMSGVLYDYLCGHEVGHALYTPSEKWIEALEDNKDIYGDSFRHFLNLPEDCRVEKKIKRKYPGLKNSFVEAFKNLLQRDFFGIKGQDINSLPFMDRLNIFSKSQYTMTEIQFSEKEQLMVDRVQELESFDDVVEYSIDLWEFCKEDMKNRQEDFKCSSDDDSDGDDFEFVTNVKGQAGDEDYDLSQNVGSQDFSNDDSDGDDFDDVETGSQGQMNSQGGNKDSDPLDDYSDTDPTCQTQENFEKKQSQLLSDKNKDLIYINVPTFKLKDVLTPAKRVQQLLTRNFTDQLNRNFYYFRESTVSELVSSFKKKNDKYVSLLAKEFEMKKAAKKFSKSRLSDTGDIDVNRLHSYKFNDEIFKRVMSVPKGKSHGLILLLDRSGSMRNNMKGSIEQILVLAMFCRKVNIPFAVYGFNDSIGARMIDEDKTMVQVKNHVIFSRNVNDLILRSCFIREYINSDMSNAEFNRSLRNMIILGESFNCYSGIVTPDQEKLTNTPMIEAMVYMQQVMKNFRNKYNLEITNLVIVHDGDADQRNQYVHSVVDCGNEFSPVSATYRVHSQVVYLCDHKNSYQKKIHHYDTAYTDSTFSAILEWFKTTTKSNVVGFYIAGQTTRETRGIIKDKYYGENGETFRYGYSYTSVYEKLIESIKDQNFVVSHNPGYSKFYFINGGARLNIVEDNLKIDGKVTPGKLRNAFMKFNRNKSVNRVLVSKFIDNIAV